MRHAGSSQPQPSIPLPAALGAGLGVGGGGVGGVEGWGLCFWTPSTSSNISTTSFQRPSSEPAIPFFNLPELQLVFTLWKTPSDSRHPTSTLKNKQIILKNAPLHGKNS